MKLLLSVATVAIGASALLALASETSSPAVASSPQPAAARTYQVDLNHSNILFKCKHFGVSYQWGRFDQFEGSFTLDEDSSKSNVSITVAAESVNSNDQGRGRDKHLRNVDFFDAKQFPDMTFKSTAVKSKGEGVFEITGDLTLHGVTKSVTFDVTKIGEAATRMGDRCGFEGTFVIDRMDYGVDGYADALGHDVHMTFAIEGVSKG